MIGKEGKQRLTFAFPSSLCLHFGVALAFCGWQVLCGLGGVASYFILLARISSRDSKQVLNVSYLFVDEGDITPYIHHYWGWSGWVFIGAGKHTR